MADPQESLALITCYEGVDAACRDKGISNKAALWRRVQSIHERTQQARIRAGFAPLPEKGMSEESFFHILDNSLSKISPWDKGTQKWRPLAIYISVALNTPLTTLFGSVEQIEQNMTRPGAAPTPQRLHIRALMRQALHPLTGKTGITEKDLVSLAAHEYPQLGEQTFTRYLDGGAGENAIHSFNTYTGGARPWSQAIANILDLPVEQVFSYGWQGLLAKAKPSDDLGFYAYRPTDADPRWAQNPEQALMNKEAQAFLWGEAPYKPGKATPFDYHLLWQRYEMEKTLQEIGRHGGPQKKGAISNEAIRQLEQRAFKLFCDRINAHRISGTSDFIEKFGPHWG